MNRNIFTQAFPQLFKRKRQISLGLIAALLFTSCAKPQQDNGHGADASAPTKDEYTLLTDTTLEGGGETFFRSTQLAADGKIYCGLYSYDEQTQSSLEKILTFSAEGAFLEETTLPLGNTRDSVKWYADSSQNLYIAARENTEASKTSDVPLRLYKFDPAGNLCYQQEFTGLWDYTSQNIYLNDLCVDQTGQLYLLLPDTVLLFKADGSFHGSIESGQTSFQSLAAGTDDTVWLLCRSGSGGYELARIDYAGKQAPVIHDTLPEADHNRAVVCDETRFLFSTPVGPCLYQGENSAQSLLFSWLDQNLLSASVRNFGMTEDRTLILLADEKENGSQVTRLLRFAPQSSSQNAAQNPSGAPNSSEAQRSTASNPNPDSQKTVLTLAAIQLSYQENEAIVNFNRSSEKYRIEAVEYLSTTASHTNQDIDDARAKMEMDMALDTKGYDIISLNNLNVTNLAEKGMFEDLYPFLDESSVLDREDFFESILTAYTIDDKLIAIPDKVFISALIGKKADFGEQHGWTLRELLDYGRAHPETPRLFCTERQSLAASVLLSYGTDSFIRMEGGVIAFDEETCRDVLELLKAHGDTTFQIPRANLLQRGESLLLHSYIHTFDEPQYLRALFGEPVTYLGYPDPAGNCRLRYTGETEYAVSSRSDCKEGAWEYLEFFLNNSTSDTIFPSQKSRFEEMAQRQLTEQYVRDEAGNIALDQNGNPKLTSTKTTNEGSGEELWSFTYGPITQEDVDWVREMLESSGGVWQTVDNTVLYQTTMEEGAAYFSGQKPIGAVTDILKNRLSLYLSE